MEATPQQQACARRVRRRLLKLQAMPPRRLRRQPPVTRKQVLQAKTVADMQKLFPTGNPAAQALATILRRKP